MRIDVFGHDPDGVLDERVHAPAEVMPEAMRFARILCDAGSLAVQAVKRSVVEGLALPPKQALEREMELGIPVSCRRTAERARRRSRRSGSRSSKDGEEFAPCDQSERRKFRRYTR